MQAAAIDSDHPRSRRRRHLCSAALTAAAAWQVGARMAKAADYPARQVRFVVPFPPGGAADVVARLFAEPMGRLLGQSVYIENKPGAGTTIGAAQVARAEPDGYTLLFTTSSPITVAPHFQKASYRPEQDFDTIMLVGDTPMIVVTSAQHSSIATLEELIARIRSQPGKVTAALTGNGTIGHLATEQFRHMGGLDFLQVPYKGIGEAYNDLIAGRLDFAIVSFASAMPHLERQQLRALAVTTRERSPALPRIPTVAEAGVPGYDISFWFGILGPRGLPVAVTATVARAAREAMADPTLRGQMERLWIAPRQIAGDEFRALIRTENAQWDALVKKSGARLH
ncbi:tripartite tricarboxylate transporter substrate binding protein [Pigmentiphaga sp. NML080357]|uniref:Bug family tripartite tricarboxylate transporter substrate binding protein n=1 Tax=Pigmentiphaga sp. NML080357 TaxID=2008675 RepID=UPI0013038E25|nr:tripartite tricarboxylate transporter substrate binding protein [Pigmentiphaga sp. NML080357]